MTSLLIFSRLGETIPSPSNACLKAALAIATTQSQRPRHTAYELVSLDCRTSNSQEIDLYALLEDGVYVYDAATHRLRMQRRDLLGASNNPRLGARE